MDVDDHISSLITHTRHLVAVYSDKDIRAMYILQNIGTFTINVLGTIHEEQYWNIIYRLFQNNMANDDPVVDASLCWKQLLA